MQQAAARALARATPRALPAAHARAFAARALIAAPPLQTTPRVASPLVLVAAARRPACRRGFCAQATSSAAQPAGPPAPAAGQPAPAAAAPPTWRIRVLYDGDCPLCVREIDMLRRRDAGRGAISFVDIAAPSYRPEDNAGLSFETAMSTIHAILPDGRVITGVAVFRGLYDAVGLGWLFAITRLPVVSVIAERVYAFWAKRRLAITGRPGIEQLLAAKRLREGGAVCDAGCRDGSGSATPQ